MTGPEDDVRVPPPDNDAISPHTGGGGVNIPIVDSATARRMRLADSSDQGSRQAAALSAFVAGGSERSVPTGGKKRRRAAAAPPLELTGVAALSSFLLSRQQRLTVLVGAIEIEMRACVHVDIELGYLTLVAWGDDASSLRLREEGTAVVLNLADGRTFHALFLGLQMRLGLHGMLTGFNLVTDG